MVTRFYYWFAIGYFIVAPLRLWQCFVHDQPLMHDLGLYEGTGMIVAVAGIVLILHTYQNKWRKS